jgi:hypothetical protein
MRCRIVYNVAALLKTIAVMDGDGHAVDRGTRVTWMIQQARRAHAAGYKLIFLGIGAYAGSGQS